MHCSTRKNGVGFDHTSALIEKVLRPLTIIYARVDLDELSIFCHETWSPDRTLPEKVLASAVHSIIAHAATILYRFHLHR